MVSTRRYCRSPAYLRSHRRRRTQPRSPERSRRRPAQRSLQARGRRDRHVHRRRPRQVRRQARTTRRVRANRRYGSDPRHKRRRHDRVRLRDRGQHARRRGLDGEITRVLTVQGVLGADAAIPALRGIVVHDVGAVLGRAGFRAGCVLPCWVGAAGGVLKV